MTDYDGRDSTRYIHGNHLTFSQVSKMAKRGFNRACATTSSMWSAATTKIQYGGKDRKL